MQAVIDQLGKITTKSSEAEILSVLNKVAQNQSDPELREHFLQRLKSDREQDQCALNILAAGYFAVCLGSKYMLPDTTDGYKVNPFLHNLRKAMLACPLIRQKSKENARQYVFYTEFYEAISSLRARIAAMAKAHAGADSGNDLLTVLYSLGGFFNKAETEIGLKDAKSAGGTTCVMTARGIYHAAGLKMIGDRDPVVGTPNGPQIELGVPSHRTLMDGNRLPVATMMRDDQYAFGAKGFDDDNADERNRPKLDPGDIYYIDGEGDFRFLLRVGNAVAAHVGVVVENRGTAVDTIDGGAGGGALIELRSNRAVKYLKGLGWSLDQPGKSFSVDNIQEVETYMAQFRTEEAILRWLRQNPAHGKAFIPQIEKFDKDIQKNAANAALVKQLQRGRNTIIDAARRRIREMKKGQQSLGQNRVLKGWWKPERYAELSYVGRQSVREWLGA